MDINGLHNNKKALLLLENMEDTICKEERKEKIPYFLTFIN